MQTLLLTMASCSCAPWEAVGDVLAAALGDPDGVLHSWLQLGSALAVAGIREVKQ